MKEVLENLANWLLVKFCEENSLDCSNTHIAKNGRGFKYSLVKNNTGQAFITISFTKHSSPTYFKNN